MPLWSLPGQLIVVLPEFFLHLDTAATATSSVTVSAVLGPGLHLLHRPDPGADSAAEHETVSNRLAAVLTLGVFEESLLHENTEVTT